MLELSYLKNIDFGLDTWKPETLLYIKNTSLLGMQLQEK